MKYLNKLVLAVVMGLSFGATGAAAFAQTSAASAQTALTEGEIKKVDKDAGKLTIKHGEIRNLGMPGMTMVFKVRNPAMLDQVKPGDKVRFTADNVNGALTVTAIDVAK